MPDRDVVRYVDGIYEEVVSNKLAEFLQDVAESKKDLENLDPAETPAILAQYAEKLIRKRLEAVAEDAAVDRKDDPKAQILRQISVFNEIVKQILVNNNDSRGDLVAESAQLLRGLDTSPQSEISQHSAKMMVRPETSVAQSSLFTNAPREPNLAGELQKEIDGADSIDILISFIRWSGLCLLIEQLRRFAERGKRLRIITTTYMAVTEPEAMEKLAALPNTELRVSYDSQRTRLHAKVYVFHRNSGYSTAYVGSSNMTAPAMTAGCEWNVKVTQNDQPDVFEKIAATFRGYWNSAEYKPYDKQQFVEALESVGNKTANDTDRRKHYFLDVAPYPYQQEILDKLDSERRVHGSYRNLVCAATGTGKTVISALDYRRACAGEGRRLKLLFIAHRKEILDQALACYREVMRDSEFGDVLYSGAQAQQTDYLFVTIETLNSRKEAFRKLGPKYYDYVVFDECHHSAANTYQDALNYFHPIYLLGLTATPERMDGASILPYFDNHIAAEIRLPEAIDRKLLSPFCYFGVADSVDLSGLRWSKKGYDVGELEDAYIGHKEAADARARLIVNTLDKYVGNIDAVKGLAFCVSVKHAEFMAEKFNAAGIPSLALTGAAGKEERESARAKLESGKLKFLCVVDLYNEGVDIKRIDTILFLRPTESLTIFLQQLGRGLRLAEGKNCLTVLDFIGRANKKYNKFEAKYAALLGGSNRGTRKEIEAGFPDMPRGCFIKLEEKAREYVLKSIKEVSGKKGFEERLIQYYQLDPGSFSAYEFFNEYGITPQELYSRKLTATQVVRGEACKKVDPETPKKLFRLTALDSKEALDYLIANFPKVYALFSASELTEKELEYWKMLYATFIDGAPKGKDAAEKDDEIKCQLEDYWRDNQVMESEVVDVMKYNRAKIDFVEKPNDLPYDCALKTHCTYTRAQALAALDYWLTSSEGVTRVKDKKTTCLFVTLNKSDHFYSPATAYHDYSINENLFHWQSQNATAPDTAVGQRYIRHKELQENILLFVREQKSDRLGPVTFTLLGCAEFVEYQGEKPMNITWRLKEAIPAKFLKITDKLGVGV